MLDAYMPCMLTFLGRRVRLDACMSCMMTLLGRGLRSKYVQLHLSALVALVRNFTQPCVLVSCLASSGGFSPCCRIGDGTGKPTTGSLTPRTRPPKRDNEQKDKLGYAQSTCSGWFLRWPASFLR